MHHWPTHHGYPYHPDFWEHYTEHPDIYDRFALSTNAGVDVLRATMDLADADVLDIAAGTGRSTFALAQHARRVLGVEPEAAMRGFALAKGSAVSADNVDLIEGSTSALPPLTERSFDLVTSFHGAPFAAAEVPGFVRTLLPRLRAGGSLVVQMVTPGWRHEFHVGDQPGPVADPDREIERGLLAHGFVATDTVVEVDHGSIDEALATYGFIYGPPAIDWLLDGRRSSVHWSLRTYRRLV